jgi:hypothetical protein
MSLLGWVLLEYLVHADVWIRTTVSAGAPPVTALVLLALVVALAIAIACASQSLLCILLSVGVRSAAPGREDHPGPGSLSVAWSAPVGGIGPRAPGGRLRRPRSPQAAL